MKKNAFTLIEVITVIAIIIILMSIGIPIYATVRENSFKREDFSDLNELRQSMSLYREDQGGFPPQILGYSSLYSKNNSVVPANQVQSYLYPRRIDSINTFNSNQNRVGSSDVTPVVWSNKDVSMVGTNPQFDLDGNGYLDSNDDDTAAARQFFGPFDGCVSSQNSVDYACGANSQLFYTISGYEISRVPYFLEPSRLPQYELKYSLFWTRNSLLEENNNDDPRQLGYNNPPDDTIITWNTWWRKWENIQTYPGINVTPTRDSRDMVLTVGGAAINVPSRSMFLKSWRNKP